MNMFLLEAVKLGIGIEQSSWYELLTDGTSKKKKASKNRELRALLVMFFVGNICGKF